MGRVEIASLPWGVVQDRAGNAIQGASVTLTNLDGSPATHYSAATGGSSSTAAISSDVNGTLTGRFIDGGQYLWSSAAVSVTDRRVDAVSGSVESSFGSVSLKALGADTTGAVAADSYFATALADGRPIDLGGPENRFKITETISSTSAMRVHGRGAIVDMTSIAADVNGEKIAFSVQGSAASKVLLSADAVKGEQTITLPSVAGLAIGDWVELGTDGPRTTLTSSMTSGSTSPIPVAELSVFGAQTSGVVYIGAEAIAWNGKSGSSGAGNIGTTSVTRASETNTSAASHASASRVYDRTSSVYYQAHGANPPADRGEKKQIRGISGTDVTFHVALYDDYATANGAFCRKLTMPEDCVFEGFQIVSDDDPGSDEEYGIDLRYVNGFRIDIDASNINSMCARIQDCIRFSVNGGRLSGSYVDDATVLTNSFYGMAIYNGCQWGRIYGVHADKLRRLGVNSSRVAGFDLYGCPRFLNVFGNVGESLFVEMWEHHGYGEKIRFTDNESDGGYGLVRIEGPGITVDGGTVHNYGLYAAVVSSDVVDARDIVIRNLDIHGRNLDSVFAAQQRAVYVQLDNATTARDITIEDIRVHEWDLLGLPAIDVDGTVASENCAMRRNTVRCTGTRTTYAIDISPPGWHQHDNSIYGSEYGVRQESLGQPGLIVPENITAQTTQVLAANSARGRLFVAPRDMIVYQVAFEVTTVSGTNDAMSIAIYDSAGNRLATTGAVSGLLNAGTGVKAADLTSYVLLRKGRTYGAFYSTDGSTAAVRTTSIASALLDLLGTSLAKRQNQSLSSSHPLPSTITVGGATAGSPIIGLRER